MKKIILCAIVIALEVCMAGCGHKTELYVSSANINNQAENEPKEEKTVEAVEAEETGEDSLADTNDKDSEQWKQAYRPIVKQWDIFHSNDAAYGYDLIYMNDDDVPELLLSFDDTVWTGYDIYTCIDGVAVHLTYENESTENSIFELVSPGCLGKEDSYIEKTGIYMRRSGMVGGTSINGYLLDGNVLKDAFYYFYYEVSWDETATEPYGYTIEYTDENGEKVVKEVAVDGDGDYYLISTIPEAEEIEAVYNCDLRKHKLFNCNMDYKTICSMLGMDEGEELSTEEKYAKLLNTYMTDPTKAISEGMEGFSYQYEGGKFMLKDLNSDGVEELLLTVYGMDYNLFVPADSWDEAHLGRFSKYADNGILEFCYGVLLGSDYVFYKLEGNELNPFDWYSYEYDEETYSVVEYTHTDADGNTSNITEEEFNNAFSIYGVHSLEGEWYDINEENIKKILLAD